MFQLSRIYNLLYWLYSFASIHYNVQSFDRFIYFFFIRLSGNDARKDRKLSPRSESLGCIMFRGLPRKAPFSALNLAANTIHKNRALCQVQKGWCSLFHISRFDAPYVLRSKLYILVFPASTCSLEYSLASISFLTLFETRVYST